ncbi:MAG: TatD family hydrolase [Candidatus Thiodiazotropha sp.]
MVMDSVGFEDDDQSTTRATSPPPTCPPPTRPRHFMAWDSHFHLDRSSRKIFGHLNASVQEVLHAEVGVRPNLSVNVEGGVLVYCDPEHYPAQVPKEKGFGVAVGVHPKKVALFHNDQYGKLRDLLRLKEVVALGEIGLDHTEPESTWKDQEDTLIKVLQLSMPIRPLIIHFRDPKDKHCGELSTRCLQIMRANVAPTQKIHLHCFGGTVEQVVSWMEAFPRCYFGFTGSVTRFDEFQKAALRKVPRGHLLLETDSPYFMPSRALANTPAFIGDVATAVAGIRKEAVEDVLDLTAANTRVLYLL